MRVAQHYLEKQYPNVKDVSASESFDFHCARGSEELRVEVKGTTGDCSAVVLTRKEIEHARTHRKVMALIVVSNIRLDESDTGKWKASGGELHVFAPWRLAEANLMPISFCYRLDA